MSKRYLVTGATGHTGGNSAKLLIQAGAQVRAFVHCEDERSEALVRLGAEVVTGDLLDFETVRTALEGVDGAYFVYPIRPGIHQATTYFAQAAKEAGVTAIVNMSQISARREAKSHAAQDHWIAEQVFNWSGVPTTHLRPTLFAEWSLYFMPLIRTGILSLPFGTGKHAPITAEDQARVITAILLSPEEHQGNIYPLYGDKEYTFAEITAEISNVIGKPLRYQQVDAWELKRLVTPAQSQAGEPDKPRRELARHTDTLWQHFEEIAKDHQAGIFAGTNDLVQKIGGRPPKSLQQFLHENRGAFPV